MGSQWREARWGEVSGQFGELPGQGKQRCFEVSAVCLRDTEDSQTGENFSSQGVKDQRQRQE